MKIAVVSSHIHKLCEALKTAADPLDPALDTTTDVADPAAAPEEKDQETLYQENVTANQDKYRKAFEDLFPTTQMSVSAIEYRGDVVKDKIRVMVDFQTPLLNFDALQVLSDKEIGLEATGEKTFKVYNIYLPMIKGPKV